LRFRGMTEAMRKSQASAVGASPMQDLDGQAIRRTLIGAVMIGLFLAVVGAFGTGDVPFLMRSGILTAIALIGAGSGMATYATAGLIPGLINRPMARGFVGGLIQSLPMTGVIVGMDWMTQGRLSFTRDFLQDYPVVLVVCLTMSVIAPALNHQAKAAKAAKTDQTLLEPAPLRFLERLPLKLRGAEIWAVEAEDHYLRLHTSKGQELILLRLSDAIEELAGLEGEQSHRSWWVARDGVADVERGDGRAVLTLKNGQKAPVSRTYAKILREKGWF